MHIFDNAFTFCKCFELLKKIFVDIYVILLIFKWFKNVLYMLCTNLGQNYLHFVVCFVHVGVSRTFSVFPSPSFSSSSFFSIFPRLCLYLWMPFQVAWRSFSYGCAELSMSTTALFSSMESLPRLSSSKHLVRISRECSCVSSKTFSSLSVSQIKVFSYILCKLENLLGRKMSGLPLFSVHYWQVTNITLHWATEFITLNDSGNWLYL